MDIGKKNALISWVSYAVNVSLSLDIV